ncbi:efflux RND transporter periplasmic adaptor subunit [Acinetobacter baylyi]|uniref:efflux RND transporter periplasmic adaptor subunit n=1 Tax=Acinetobacter baylyi TaxID=202950 RepID=UPI000EA3A619|nr:efflux RND transporter periplasmic adaptor subunit [Acinetobacter baylyi]
MNRIFLILSGWVMLCMLGLSGCHKQTADLEQAPLVMVAQPQSSQSQAQSYAGKVQARQQTALSFRVGGQITERLVEVGDRVHVGQVLAKLDVQDAQLQLNAAKAQLDNAQSAAKIAADELQRYQQLLPINAVSRSQYDAIKNQYDAAQSSLKQARSNYDVASNQTNYNRLLANKNGVITERLIEVGQVVAAGQTAYQLAIDGDREVVIGLPEQSISSVKVGQPAWMSLWSQPEQKFAAYVREIAPAADQSRTFSVKVALKQAQPSIQMGQSARVFLNATPQQSQLSIPMSSISATKQQPYVWIVKPNNTIQKVNVQLGAYGRDEVTILSGLKSSDWVVVGGVHLLRDQQKIRPIDRENRAVNIQTGAVQ